MVGNKWKAHCKLHWEGGVRAGRRINLVLKCKPQAPAVCRQQVYGRVESRLESMPQTIFAFHFPSLTVLHPNCQCSSVKHRGRKEKSLCKLAVCSPGSCYIISHESWLFLTTVVCQFQNKELCDVSGAVHLTCHLLKLCLLILTPPPHTLPVEILQRYCLLQDRLNLRGPLNKSPGDDDDCFCV